MRLLTDADWRRLEKDMANNKEDTVIRLDAGSGYIVTAITATLDSRMQKIRGNSMVLTIAQTFPNGVTSTCNFDNCQEARRMLYG